MGRGMPNQKTLNVRIPMDLMDEFRQKAYQKCNFEKGAIKKACIEALEEWCSKH
jgi:hypothetical protein